MKIDASPARAQAILAAMKTIAGVELSPTDGACIRAAGIYLFGSKEPPDSTQLPKMTPHGLAEALRGSNLDNDARRRLTAMALMNGRLDNVKIQRVVAFAEALHIHPDHVDELAHAASGDLQGALAQVFRDNMDSATGKPWAGGDLLAWMLPYRQQPDAALAARFRALTRTTAKPRSTSLRQAGISGLEHRVSSIRCGGNITLEPSQTERIGAQSAHTVDRQLNIQLPSHMSKCSGNFPPMAIGQFWRPAAATGRRCLRP